MGIGHVYDDGGRAAAGFKGEARDCVARAIAIATGKPYREVYDALNAWIKRYRPRCNKHTSGREGARTGVRKRIRHAYLTALSWRWTPTMRVGSGCRVHLRADELPPGRLLVATSKHLVAVIDGVIHDTYPGLCTAAIRADVGTSPSAWANGTCRRA
jgi:hypothetical protein